MALSNFLQLYRIRLVRPPLWDIERARGMALDFMNEARRRLADCPSGFEHELLDELAASMVDRYS